jgi:hypothetical protein
MTICANKKQQWKCMYLDLEFIVHVNSVMQSRTIAMKKQTGRIEAAFSKHSTYLRKARPPGFERRRVIR